MIARAAYRLLRFAREKPNDTLQYNNRGCVWLAITQLCGLYLDDPRYSMAARQHAGRILEATLAPSGEVLENYFHDHGGGPDVGYSYTVWSYAMMYRLLAGDPGYDDRLLRTLRWLTCSTTRTGEFLAVGASVRLKSMKDIHRYGPLVEDLLPAYEFFADREPFFDRLADRFSRHPVRHSISGHTVSFAEIFDVDGELDRVRHWQRLRFSAADDASRPFRSNEPENQPFLHYFVDK